MAGMKMEKLDEIIGDIARSIEFGSGIKPDDILDALILIKKILYELRNS